MQCKINVLLHTYEYKWGTLPRGGGRTTNIRKVKYSDLDNSSMSDCGRVPWRRCSVGPITHCCYQSWPHSRHPPPHVKNLNLAYSCIQRDARCSDNVATDLSLSLKTSLLLSASIISTAGLSIPPDLHHVLMYRAVTLFKTLKTGSKFCFCFSFYILLTVHLSKNRNFIIIIIIIIFIYCNWVVTRWQWLFYM